MSSVQPEMDTAFVIDAGGRGPVHIICADHTTPTANQRVRNALVLVSVAGHGQNSARVQYEHWHARSGKARARRVGSHIVGV